MVLLDHGGCAFVNMVNYIIASGGLAAMLVNDQDAIITVSNDSNLSVLNIKFSSISPLVQEHSPYLH